MGRTTLTLRILLLSLLVLMVAWIARYPASNIARSIISSSSRQSTPCPPLQSSIWSSWDWVWQQQQQQRVYRPSNSRGPASLSLFALPTCQLSSRQAHTMASSTADGGMEKEFSSPSSTAKTETSTPSSTTAKDELPPLSPADFKVYNRLAVHMDYFHTHFRHTWTLLHNACTTNTRPSGMSIRQFLQTGLQLISHLETHHGIEEHYVFPMLAKKMPRFREKDHLINQHKQIHRGLEEMEGYLEACRSGERELVLTELKQVMDGFGEVLWRHLDDEVEELGGNNMRKFWTKEEMSRLQL